MALPTLLELAESGAHYGHHRSFVYPKARPYVFGVRHNVALIDLEQTLEQLKLAQAVLAKVRSEGQTVLFVGTKRGVKDIVKRVAESAGQPYVTERWLGGFLTNFESIHDNIKKMNELDEFLAGDESKGLSKIDRLRATNKLARYHRFLAGVTNLNSRPGLIVMASASQDRIALSEANAQNIPVIALCDTDTNPDRITYPIPANDDAANAVELILNTLIAAPVAEKKIVTKSAKEATVKEVAVKVAAKPKAAPKTAKKAVSKAKPKTAAKSAKKK